MLFNSWQFLVFLAVAFTVYFLLPKKIRHYFLLAASYFFYGFWDWRFIFLMLATTGVSYLSGFFIAKYPEKKKLRVLLLISTILVSLGALFFFKYFNFIAESVASLVHAFGGQETFDALDIILPVGISFYTFQTLSYVIDVYRGKIAAEKNPVYYALYVSFFPQLVAGPIERPENLLPQFKEKEGIKKENLSIGLRFMVQGFVKKILIADFLATFVNAVYNNLGQADGMAVFIATLCFALQIYGDFSGYSDIAFGTAKLFNITLSKNFDKPYESASIQEFWKRWHISLSSWFRDYLYIPLGGSRVCWARWALNVTIVFLCSGLWHGAAWTFLIFGALHAFYQIIGRATKGLRDKAWTKMHVNPEGKPVRILRIIVTFALVCLAWIPFRSNSIADMGQAYAKLFTGWTFDFSSLASLFELAKPTRIVLLVLSLGAFFVVERIANLPFKKAWVKSCVYVLCIWAIMAAFVYLKAAGMDSTFIYFQF